MIEVTDTISLGEKEIVERFVLSRGPGGQNVNKLATTVQLRFDVESSRSLSGEVKDRLRRIAGRRIDKNGVLLIRARRYRSLERNRRDARQRLVKLIQRAAERRKPRKLRRGEGRRAKANRVEAKRRRGSKKQLRAKPSAEAG